MNSIRFLSQDFIDNVDIYAFGSPIEHEFYRVVKKYLSPKVEIQNQYKAKAGGYNFFVDFVILTGPIKIGIECDGKDYHSQEKDEWRDNLILNGGHLDSIIRVRGSDINFRLPDVLYVMALWYPQIFSSRGVDNIAQLATATARASDVYDQGAHFVYKPHEEHQGEELDSDEVIDDKFSEGFGELFVSRRFPDA